MNLYGQNSEPFFFCISYDMSKWDVIKLSTLPDDIKFEINNKNIIQHNYNLDVSPISFKSYKKEFEKIQKHIECGNTYVTNLTTTTQLNTKYTLQDIYEKSNGKFKLYFKDKFVCFSPERFVKCINNKIFTYPMKGTIDAKYKNAKDIILKDKKELAEHTMVVDLLRNDLSVISSNVKVNKFRYSDTIYAGDKKLIQISSQIQGDLKNNWMDNIGDIVTSILPAGSITGTPKKKTIEIIDEVENHKRDYFSGIFGVFNGKSLDSAVMIRFIQKDIKGDLVYKSGGGITCDSDVKNEYQEMISKIYIP
jgi:para-aminobenzoate synthetase component 1